MPRSLYLSLAVAAAFILCVPGANWAIANIGTTCIPDGPCLLPVGFGLDAPSGSLLFISGRRDQRQYIPQRINGEVDL